MTGAERDTATGQLAELLKILVCPIDHARLRGDGGGLVCTHCGRRYPVEDGIPNMLVEPL